MFWQKKTVVAGCPLVILLLFVFGWHHDLFHTTAYYDVFMHVLGGGFLVITLAGIGWHGGLKYRTARRIHPARIKATLAAGLVLSSIAWEIFEVIFNLTPNWTQSVGDTVSDMICAWVGGAVALHYIRPEN